MNIEQPPTFAKKSTNKKRLAKELAAYAEELAAGRWQEPAVIHVDITRNVMEQLDDITLGDTPSPVASSEGDDEPDVVVAPIIDTIRLHFAADKEDSGETIYTLESGADQTIDVTDIPQHLLREILDEAREDSDHALWEPLHLGDDDQDIEAADAAELLYAATLSRMETVDYKISSTGKIFDYSLQHGYIMNDQLVKDASYSPGVAPTTARAAINYNDDTSYDTVTADLPPLTDDEITRQLPQLEAEMQQHSLQENAHDLVTESAFPHQEHVRRALGILALLRGKPAPRT